MSYLPEDKATAVTVTSETDEDGIERTYLKFPNTVYISGSPDEIDQGSAEQSGKSS